MNQVAGLRTQESQAQNARDERRTVEDNGTANPLKKKVELYIRREANEGEWAQTHIHLTAGILAVPLESHNLLASTVSCSNPNKTMMIL